MNTVQLNFDALVTAVTALLGNEKAQMLSEFYVLLDNAEKRGHATGYNTAHDDSYAAGHADGINEYLLADDKDLMDGSYDEGFADGVAQRASDAFEFEADAFQDGFDEGYEQARAELGECPIVEPDFDVDEEGYLRSAVKAMMD